MYNFICLLLLFLVSSICYGGTIDSSNSDNSYIEFGKKFTCVKSLVGQESVDKSKLYVASSVIIDKHWILTAAHVVDRLEEIYIIHNEEKFLISKVFVHKNFNINNFGEADIALGYSEKELKLEFYPVLYSDNDETDKICAIAGYGATGTLDTGISSYDGKLRAGSNKISYIYKDLLICVTDKNRSKLYLEILPASGDSGGGLFIDGKLAGIISGVIAIDKKTDSNYGDEGCFTRVSNHIEWINSIKNDQKE
jgi:secreted trypsin-like serine protease